MGNTLEMPHAHEAEQILNYPPEHLYFKWAAPASLALHLFAAGTVILLMYLHHQRTLAEMMTASVVQPPPQQIEILLIDENKPPPPTDNPVWIKQLIIPKNAPPPPPPPKPKPKPPKPVPARIVPRLIVGANNLPVPSYPYEAYQAHIEGTVMVQVTFDGSGSVENAEVVDSSGSPILDSGARHFILENWHSKAFSGQTQTVPIRYQFPH